MSDLGNKKVFAKNLKAYMKSHNIDRQQLCKHLGFKYTTVSEWLSGNKYPRIDKIEMLANYFSIQKSDLIEEKNKTPKSSPDNSDETLMFALYGYDDKEITPEMLSEVRRYAQYLKDQKKNNTPTPKERKE